MSSPHPLRGRRILVTRPEGQAAGLMEGIQALGGEATHIPLLAIEATVETPALTQIADRLTDYRAVIFISANAVRIAWPALTRTLAWPSNVATAAVGPGTARELKTLGVSQVVVPESRFDSEGLLAEPFFAEQHCREQSFALIRGEGGRDFLAPSLRARGARVDEAAVYRRSLHPRALSRLEDWLAGGDATDTLLISSSESLQRVMAAASPELAARLHSLCLVVPHPRIAEAARELGFARVAVSDGGDAGLLTHLQSYNQTQLS